MENKNLKVISGSRVLKEYCVYVDRNTQEKKDYVRYLIEINGIKCKCIPSKEGMEVIEQYGYKEEDYE